MYPRSGPLSNRVFLQELVAVALLSPCPSVSPFHLQTVLESTSITSLPSKPLKHCSIVALLACAVPAFQNLPLGHPSWAVNFVFAFSLSAIKYDQHDVQFIPSPKLLLSSFLCVWRLSWMDGACGSMSYRLRLSMSSLALSMFSRVVHVVVCINISFLFITQ